MLKYSIAFLFDLSVSLVHEIPAFEIRFNIPSCSPLRVLQRRLFLSVTVARSARDSASDAALGAPSVSRKSPSKLWAYVPFSRTPDQLFVIGTRRQTHSFLSTIASNFSARASRARACNAFKVIIEVREITPVTALIFPGRRSNSSVHAVREVILAKGSLEGRSLMADPAIEVES